MDFEKLFQDVFEAEPTIISKAPGRVNLIGEHTDYNDGYVMPIAIQYFTSIMACPRNDRTVRLFSADFKQQVSFSLDEPVRPSTDMTWSNYEKGVIVEFLKRKEPVQGVNMLIQGNVPIGAGLSSSASLEIATAMVVRALNRILIFDVELIKMCQRAENEFVGMKCGIMDQFISGMGQKGKALFLDCRTLEYEIIHFPCDLYSVVIMNTKVKRELTGSEYNERRGQCEEGVRMLQSKLPDIRALRDVSVSDFEKFSGCLSEIVKKRCEHVVKENQRVLDFKDALKAKKPDQLGKLLVQSHESLRDLYDVSCPELDLMVDIAMKTKGVIGARMTGAGFGGCAIAFIKKGNEKLLEENILEQYTRKTGIQPEIYISSASQGATVERIE